MKAVKGGVRGGSAKRSSERVLLGAPGRPRGTPSPICDAAAPDAARELTLLLLLLQLLLVVFSVAATCGPVVLLLWLYLLAITGAAGYFGRGQRRCLHVCQPTIARGGRRFIEVGNTLDVVDRPDQGVARNERKDRTTLLAVATISHFICMLHFFGGQSLSRKRQIKTISRCGFLHYFTPFSFLISSFFSFFILVLIAQAKLFFFVFLLKKLLPYCRGDAGETVSRRGP